MRRSVIASITLITIIGACIVLPTASRAQMDAVTGTSPTWFLAEGSSAWGFNTRISIENCNNARLHARITYMTADGEVEGGTISLPPESQTNVNPASVLGQADFSTKVECLEGLNIAVDRTMKWDSFFEPYPPYFSTIEPQPTVEPTGPETWWEEGHSSIGVPAPSTTWYFPEGCSAFGFVTWLLIQNPNAAKARCTVTYMTEDAGPVVVVKEVAGKSRASFNMFDDIGARNASIEVTSNLPVVPERSMYRDEKRAGSDSIGATAPSLDYYLAEGSTAWGFTTYLLIQNPNQTNATVDVSCQTAEGAEVLDPVTIPARSRKTVLVNDTLPDKDMSFRVHSSMPIVAERAMYWETGSGTACHDSIGVAAPHKRYYLPDGNLWDGETWTLVENPNDMPVRIEIAYFGDGGTNDVWFTDTIAAHSRKSYNMADRYSEYGSGSTRVTSLNSGRGIIVERSMYYWGRTGGTNTIGAWSD
jgi:hypothetical protein